ncbi:hypothetical protein LOTGIDRAFT_135497, partial [Lottia gigantea]
RLLDIPCKVCGDRSSGKHYGIYSCDGCSGFFKRSIHKNRAYTCKAQGEMKGMCPIDKTHRNQCRSCRLKKCFDADMNKDAVQHERGPRKPKLKGTDLSLGHHHNQHGHHRQVTQEVPIDLRVTSSPKNTFPLPQDCITNIASNPNVWHEVMARLLFTIIGWVKQIPAFMILTEADQVILLTTSWKDLFLLGIVQWGLPVDVNGIHRSINFLGNVGEMNPTTELDRLTETIARLREMALDPTELTCLKAICLFKSGKEVNHADGTNLVDVKTVENLQEQAHLMLTEHIQLQYPRQMVRFGRLLMLVSKLQTLKPSFIERVFFRTIVGNISIEKLVGNILQGDLV